MYHAHFRGTHYEAGFRWGSLLLKHKNIILENIPFEITQERIDYALSCLPIYEKYYHEIMEEIQGLADAPLGTVPFPGQNNLSLYAHCGRNKAPVR